MTSKHSFVNVMWEDFRHKIWMLVLSVLGSTLALPVASTIYFSQYHLEEFAPEGKTMAVRGTLATMNLFTSRYVLSTCGLIALLGAFIVGFGAFRYLHNRKMADTYYAIPVKRNRLFLAGYLNGFFIWFVPFVVNLGLTLLIIAVRRNNLASFVEQFQREIELRNGYECIVPEFSELAGKLLLSACSLVVGFLLIYHLAILASALTGNMINTIYMVGILGIGVQLGYQMFTEFCAANFTTYVSGEGGLIAGIAQALSPLLLGISYLFRAEVFDGETLNLAVGLLVAILLGVGDYLLCIHRPSEHAEQGMQYRRFGSVVRFGAGYLAGLLGFLIASNIVRPYVGDFAGFMWALFGATLSAVFAYGVSNIIFRMDMKAFFRQKFGFLPVVLLPIATACIFYFDLCGYDTRLAEKDDIAYIAILDEKYSANESVYYSSNDSIRTILKNMDGLDLDKSYAALEKMVQAVGKETEIREESKLMAYAIDVSETRTDPFTVFVKLKNGGEYIRHYWFDGKDCPELFEVLSSEEYLRTWYQVPEKVLDKEFEFTIENAYSSEFGKNDGKTVKKERLAEILRCYNEEVLEDGAACIKRNVNQVAVVGLFGMEHADDYRFIVTQNMPKTMQAIKEAFGDHLAKPVYPETIDRVEMHCGLYFGNDLQSMDGFPLKEYLEKWYGVEVSLPEGTQTEVHLTYNENGESPLQAVHEFELTITNPKEIKELMNAGVILVGWDPEGIYSVNQNTTSYAIDSREYYFSISFEKGKLPAKFIERYIREYCK